MSMRPRPLKRISGTALVESTGRRRLLFVSNGYGEDSIAAEIIRRLPADVVAEAYPTIGEGLAYRNVCAVVGPRAQLASEGWRNVRGSLARDLVSGGLRTIAPGLRFGRRVRGHERAPARIGDRIDDGAREDGGGAEGDGGCAHPWARARRDRAARRP